MFSQVFVILSFGDGMMSLPVWLPGRMFGDCLGVSVQRGLIPEGGVSVHPKSEKQMVCILMEYFLVWF